MQTSQKCTIKEAQHRQQRFKITKLGKVSVFPTLYNQPKTL